MSQNSFWAYQVQTSPGQWDFPSASGQSMHHYDSREEALRIVRIIHSGERIRLVHFEELDLSSMED